MDNYNNEIINDIEEYVKQDINKNDSSHDWHHILRVKNLSIAITKGELENGKKVNLFNVTAISLLHDSIDSKYCQNIEDKIKEIRKFLISKQIKEEDIDQILNGINNISYRKEIGRSPEERKVPLEIAIVQDADKLDAMGAIGISRCFAYSGAKGRPFYDPEIQPKINMSQEEYVAQSNSNQGTAINHFYEKLFNLKYMMKTDYGKIMAIERDRYMREFVDRFIKEYNVNNSNNSIYDDDSNHNNNKHLKQKKRQSILEYDYCKEHLLNFDKRNKTEVVSLAYGSRFATENLPKYIIPEKSSEPKVISQLIEDQIKIEANPSQNMATFVSTWMEPECEKLMNQAWSKNFADQDCYPMIQNIHKRCIEMLGHLFHAPQSHPFPQSSSSQNNHQVIGTATTGSSEAVMLGGLALKWRWKKIRKEKGLDDSKPNIIFGSNAQVALEKFARYFDVEMRMVPVDESTNFCLSPQRAIKYVDENTIGIMVILGSTYTGHFEPVEEMCKVLDDYQEKTGIDIPIHVDAAGGGFIAPFAFPDLKWSFELNRVHSINVSGHKYGLVYPGIGWIVWKSKDYLPKELIFQLNYLGSVEYTFTLNFSRTSTTVLGQYYNFLRLGYEGYTSIINNCLINARRLAYALNDLDYFNILSDVNKKYKNSYFSEQDPNHDDKDNNQEYFQPCLPVVAFEIKQNYKEYQPHVTEANLSKLLKIHGWIVPCYELPPNEQNRTILRIVIRESHSEELINYLFKNIHQSIEDLIDGKDYNLEKRKKRTSSMNYINEQNSLNLEKENKEMFDTKTKWGVC
ncbi:glutamate decarboxylase [Anaeromyces robustus]|uniref:Glutamate decarboxylase n=1 Tax=Anaeromyces robustus TaxID=1754192 RepID=A0A1Y1WT12_9FUNG|nr:glutamate decarboxylase [Anaeromyces robustus]|eukprot:ORX76690.1 glutamate decarboxylase [Anaeromyces robustus]